MLLERSCKSSHWRETFWLFEVFKVIFSIKYTAKTFQKAYLKEHMISYSEEERLKYPHCDKTVNLKPTLDHHVKVSHGAKVYSCSKCKKSLASPSGLRSHMQSHTGEKPFECSLCSKSFAQKQKLQRHMSVHIGEKPVK